MQPRDQRDERGVTVCITYFNEPHDTLSRALRSVAAQTVGAQEIIVVGDGPDEPLDTATAWLLMGETADPATSGDLRVVNVTNRGLPAARNTGLMLAKTEGVIFLDADDWLDPHYIEKTLPLLLDGADVVLTGLQEHGPTRKGCYKPGYDMPWHLVGLEDEILMNRFFYCAHFRTQTLREIGGYNPLMAGPWNRGGGYEDHDLWVDLMTRRARFAAIDDPLLNYNTDTPGSMVHRAAQNRHALVGEMRRHHRLDRQPARS